MECFVPGYRAPGKGVVPPDSAFLERSWSTIAAACAKANVAICHEGWRYPETVRWAARRGAQLVPHPHLHEAEPGGYVPSAFADPANTFHEKGVSCRAAENTCYVASVNVATARLASRCRAGEYGEG